MCYAIGMHEPGYLPDSDVDITCEPWKDALGMFVQFMREEAREDDDNTLEETECDPNFTGDPWEHACSEMFVDSWNADERSGLEEWPLHPIDVRMVWNNGDEIIFFIHPTDEHEHEDED